MALEKCKNCGGILTLIDNRWQHDTSAHRATCTNGEPGMGLLETIQLYYDHPLQYAEWARPENRYTPNGRGYTDNAILHGLQMQATVHWNNCPKSKCGNCLEAGRDAANRYMLELTNGRHDLHPNDDQEVHMLAFEIHNQLVADGTHVPSRGRPGVMTASYSISSGHNSCSCYNRGYARWVLQERQSLEHKLLSVMPFDPDDMHYEPRYE